MDLDWGRIDSQGFEKLCNELVRLSLQPNERIFYRPLSMPYQADYQSDGVLENCSFEKLKPPVRFSWKTSNPQSPSNAASKTITNEFIKHISVLLESKPKSVVLWTNHEMRPRDIKRIRDVIPKRIQVRVEGRPELEWRLFEHPYLLTKYFGWSQNILCMNSKDREGLRHTLLPDALANSVPFNSVEHPTLKNLGDPRGKHLRIVGVPGCGKSFFLYQLLSKFDDADVVILKSLVLENVEDHLRQLIQYTKRPIVVIIDNLHDLINGSQHFREIVNILLSKSNSNAFPVTIIVTHWSTKRWEIEREIPYRLWESWGFNDVLNLDNPTQEFISSVVKAACEHLKIEAEEEMQDAFVNEIIGWENTPACAVASLRHYSGKTLKSKHGFHPVKLEVRDAVWKELFAGLQNEEIPEATIILRTLSVLRWCGKQKPDLSIVYDIARNVGGALDSALNHALEKLMMTGWVQRDDETLNSHDLQIFPFTIGLYDEKVPSLFLEKFSDMVLKNTLSCIRTERLNFLSHLGQMFWNMGRYEKCMEFENAILDADPKNIRALCNRGCTFHKLGNIEEGLADLLKAAEIEPSAVGPAELLYRFYRQSNRKNEAMFTLDRLYQNMGSDQSALAFLAQLYSDLRVKKKSIDCARRLIAAEPERSESFTVLVQALWMAGRKRIARVILNQALKKWPESGELLFVQADMADREGKNDEALIIAEQALKLCPNNPSIYALTAWLNFIKGNLEKASEIAETGTELFKFWSDLLIVQGLILEKKNELSSALQILLEAFDRSEYHSAVYWPNLLLGLGRVHFRLGDKEKSEQWFSQAKNEGVSDRFIQRMKVELLQTAERIPEAMVIQEEMVVAEPDNIAEWIQLAHLYTLNQNFDRAIEALRKADSLSPNDIKILHNLGYVFNISKRFSEAVDVL